MSGWQTRDPAQVGIAVVDGSVRSIVFVDANSQAWTVTVGTDGQLRVAGDADHAGTVTQQLAAVSQAMSGTHVGPAGVSTITQQLAAVSQAMSGTAEGPGEGAPRLVNHDTSLATSSVDVSSWDIQRGDLLIANLASRDATTTISGFTLVSSGGTGRAFCYVFLRDADGSETTVSASTAEAARGTLSVVHLRGVTVDPANQVSAVTGVRSIAEADFADGRAYHPVFFYARYQIQTDDPGWVPPLVHLGGASNGSTLGTSQVYGWMEDGSDSGISVGVSGLANSYGAEWLRLVRINTYAAGRITQQLAAVSQAMSGTHVGPV